MRRALLLSALALAWSAPSPRAADPEPRPFLAGIDAGYLLDMERAGRSWSLGGRPADPLALFAQAGFDSVRVRLWTGDEGPSGLRDATALAQRAQAAGMRPYLALFLSDGWADYVKQPVPRAWADLGEADKLQAVEAYAERVARHLADAGVDIELYEIGNEIDYGIAGEFEEEWPRRISVEYMRQRRWPRVAAILLAAQRGIRRVRPDARFVLHLAQWADADYCVAFWRAMEGHGVAVDYPGLSYFPSAAADPQQRSWRFLLRQAEAIHAALGRPILLCESGYPSQPSFPGQFAAWNLPAPGYPLDEAGQARWLADLLAAARASEHLAGAFYWSPEWYGGGLWDAFALFDASGAARPALAALVRPVDAGSSAVNVYFGNLHSHTSYSDGSGAPAEAFAYARDVAGLDFLAITEHNHLLGGDQASAWQRQSLYGGPAESALIPAAARFSEDGRFIALYGQEFSSISKGNHVNVLDAPQVIDVPNGRFDLLLPWLDKNRDSTGAPPVVQLNHPGIGYRDLSANEYGRDDFGDEASWIAQMGATASLIEVLNGEPAPGDARRRSPQVMEEQYRAYLRLGFRVAPTGNQDNHQRDWGAATETRTAILAPALTRADLLAALRARHVYATEDRNLGLIFRVNGRLCGDVLAAPGEARIEYEIHDSDEPNARYTVEVFRGAVGGDLAEVVHAVAASQGAGSIPGVRLDADGQYLYFRVTQEGEGGADRAWTAPVWIDALP